MKLATQKIAEREIAVADFIPFSYHVTDTVISTKKGEYLSVWRLDGRSHQAASLKEHFDWSEDLNAVLRGLPSANMAFYSHIVRRRVFEYPKSDFPGAFARQIDDKYRASFSDVNTMVNDLYLTVIFRPSTDAVLNVFAAGERITPQERARRSDEAIAKLGEINQQIGASLKKYRPELLGVVARRNGVDVDRDEKGNIVGGEAGVVMFSTALEFLSLLVNGEPGAVPICRDRIAEYLPRNRIFFGTHGEVGEIRGADRERFFGMVDIAEYPSATEPGQLNELLESNYEFVFSQSFSCLAKSSAMAFMNRQQKHMQDAKDAGRRQVDEIGHALEAVQQGEIVLGHHHATLLVFGEDVRQVRKNLAEAMAAMTDHGVIAKRCDVSLEAAFWAQLPGNWERRPRPAPITSRNFFSFSPFHNFMSGKPAGNPWGPAVTMLKTTSGTPLYLSFHASAPDIDVTDKRMLGNTMILGESGAGKTVTLSFLLAQADKFKPRIVSFDKDRGMEIFIRALGGRYLPLKNGVASGFNPLQMELTPANMMFLKGFVRLLVSVDGSRVTHRDETEIENALGMLKLLKPADRRLMTLLEALPNPLDHDSDHPTVAARLKKWTHGGELGWLFDNPTDALDLTTHRYYGFDITEFLDNDVTRPAVMMYLIYRTEAMIDGNPFIYVFDEFWKALQDPQFEQLTKDKVKTIRKQNGIFVFATQEPGDALNSNIGKTIVAQCATMILLPNKAADKADYIEGLHLSETEFELVRSLAAHSRQFLVKQGEASTVAKLDLRGFDDEMLVLSGTPDNAEMVETIIADLAVEHGADKADDPETWLPVFTERANAERIR